MKAGLVGLGVMGRNLALNMHDKGHEIVATDSWESARSWSAPGITVAGSHADLAATLPTPRVILLMVKAGEQVDQEIADLLPHLQAGDTVIDGGNSLYLDTERRTAELERHGIGYFGVGISGGAEGARHGAAMMVGGQDTHWQRARELLSSVAAIAHDGTLTIDRFGAGGSGHFVKMVHNGIEYAIMQAIAETHGLMERCAAMTPDTIAGQFAAWSRQSDGAGFLLEITAEIANARDALTDNPLLPLIDDQAGQKGTGGWTARAALEYGVPASTIMEAVTARQLSGNASARNALRAAVSAGPETGSPDPGLVDDLEEALMATMVVALLQGLEIYRAAAHDHGWRRDLSSLLRVWRAGSILRMRMLDRIAGLLDASPDLENCFADKAIAAGLARSRLAWRRVITAAVNAGYPTPVLSAALTVVETLATKPLPTAMIQAQRDRFGDHGFRRTDRPGNHHGPWIQPDREA